MTPSDSRTRRGGILPPRQKGQSSAVPLLSRPAFHIIVLLIVIALGGAAVWFFARPAPAPKPQNLKTAKPSLVTPHTPAPAKAKTPAPKPEAVEKKPPALPPWRDEFINDFETRLKYSTLYEARTNAGGMITQRLKLPNGKIWRRVIDPPPIFASISDNAIAMTIRNERGVPSPPVPGLQDANLDEEFAKSFATPIHIGEDDSPEVAAIKMAVKEARSVIAEMKKNGDERSIGEILSDELELNNHQAALRGDAYRAIEAERKEHGDEAAEEYRTELNKALEAYGVDPLPAVDRAAADDDAEFEAEQEASQKK